MSSAMTTRLLVAGPLATVVSGHLEQLLAPAVVVTASTPVEIRAALHTRLRFDAILTDLVSHDRSWAPLFDGVPGMESIDVISEDEYVAELAARDEVAALVLKSQPLADIARVLGEAAAGRTTALPRRSGDLSERLCRHPADDRPEQLLYRRA